MKLTIPLISFVAACIGMAILGAIIGYYYEVQETPLALEPAAINDLTLSMDDVKDIVIDQDSNSVTFEMYKPGEDRLVKLQIFDKVTYETVEHFFYYRIPRSKERWQQ